MNSKLDLNILRAAVSGPAAAFRCRRKLQPAGGPGDKVFPPTYSGGVYAVEHRRVPDRVEAVPCVLLDSVQAQVNRMEEALQSAVDAKAIVLPLIVVDFSKEKLPEPVGRLTSLQLPHRFADAILRDSEHGGKRFRESDVAKGLNSATPLNATALFELCPTALLFGSWDSTGPKGGLGTKFERAMVSEAVGIGAVLGVKPSSRIDPLINKTKGIKIYRSGESWTTDEIAADKDSKGKPIEVGKGEKAGKASAVNLGNVTPTVASSSTVMDGNKTSGGITIEYAEQITTLSLIVLRRLHFPVAKPTPDQASGDVAARTVLAALGLYAATAAFESGMGLRSRCLLWPEAAMKWELLAQPGKPPEEFELSSADCLTLLNEAIVAAKAAGVTWREEELVLQPSAELVKLVALSQEQAKESGAEAEAD